MDATAGRWEEVQTLHASTPGFASKVGGKTASLLVKGGWRDGRLDG